MHVAFVAAAALAVVVVVVVVVEVHPFDIVPFLSVLYELKVSIRPKRVLVNGQNTSSKYLYIMNTPFALFIGTFLKPRKN